MVLTRAPLSVVIPTRDRPAQLEACLRSLLPVLGDEDEVVVVDSASTTDETAAVAARVGVKCLRAPRPGASLARNIGWRAARHELIAFTDDDTQLRPGWADAFVATFDDPNVAFVTGSIRAAEGARADGPVPNMLEEEAFPLDRARRGSLGASANLAVRRSLLAQVGGFDDELGPGRWFRAAEDADLFDRFLLTGARGLYQPKACVEHNQWRNRRGMLRLDYGYGIGMGARLARLWRTDRARARVEIVDLLWTNGLRVAIRDLLSGADLAAATGLLRFAGSVIAFPVALVRLPATPRSAPH